MGSRRIEQRTGKRGRRDSAANNRKGYAEALQMVETRDLGRIERGLRDSPELAKASGEDGETLLHWACHHKWLDGVELLLKAGAIQTRAGLMVEHRCMPP
jgi:hypothetical protein